MQSLRGGQIILRTRVLDLSSERSNFFRQLLSADGNRDLLEAVRGFHYQFKSIWKRNGIEHRCAVGNHRSLPLGPHGSHAILLEIVLQLGGMRRFDRIFHLYQPLFALFRIF